MGASVLNSGLLFSFTNSNSKSILGLKVAPKSRRLTNSLIHKESENGCRETECFGDNGGLLESSMSDRDIIKIIIIIITIIITWIFIAPFKILKIA